MYYVEKTLEVSASHQLKLNYKSPCNNLHGHTYKITVYCKSKELDENGMVVDFKVISELIKNLLDHKNLNDFFNFNTTSENIAKYICDLIKNCYKVKVSESPNNVAIYEGLN
jgi:6-pyruvoyltetrahydropterin/6-carboxytetrahydropterin synthase